MISNGPVFGKYTYYAALAELASACIDLYVDLFLLWLLYRFMQPQPILNDGRTQASTLLLSLAHDS